VKQTETGTPQRRRSQARTPPVASGRRRSQARTPPVTSSRRRSRKSFGRQSFIYQILSASKQQSTEPHGNKTTPVLKIYGGPAMEGESTSRKSVQISQPLTEFRFWNSLILILFYDFYLFCKTILSG